MALLLLTLLWGCANALAAPIPVQATMNDAVFGNGTFVAVGDNGSIYSSVQGGPWLQRQTDTTKALSCVAYGNGYFIAAGTNGTVVVSPDGIRWESHSLVVTQTNVRITFGNGVFVVGGNGPKGYWTFLVSSQGSHWQTAQVEALGQKENGGLLNFAGVSYLNGKFLAVGGGLGVKLFLHSTDGLTWQEQGITGLNASSYPNGPLVNNGREFATPFIFQYNDDDDDDDGGYYMSGIIYTSRNGVDWTGTGINTGVIQGALATSGCQTFTAPYTPTAAISLYTSGTFTTNLTLPTPQTVRAIVARDNELVVLGSSIQSIPLPVSSPSIVISPSGAQTYLESTANVFVSATPSCLQEPIVFQWQKDGLDLIGETNRYFNISQLSTNRSGSYTLHVTDANGTSLVSAPLVLNVKPLDPPGLSAPDITYPTTEVNSIFPEDGPSWLFLPGTVSGNPTPTIQWYFNNTLMAGETNANLVIFEPAIQNQGEYYFIAKNRLGQKQSASYKVTISSVAPVGTPLVTSYSPIEGTSLELPSSNLLIGSPLGDYHLFKDGTEIFPPFEANGSIRFRNVTSLDEGTYLLTLSNYLGSATGLLATVTLQHGDALNHWTPRNPLPGNLMLQSIAYGTSGFIAVGDQSTVVTSLDGEEWTSNSSINSISPLVKIAFGKGKYVAMDRSNLLVSEDAKHWSRTFFWQPRDLSQLLFDGNQFVAWSPTFTFLSSDGVHWSKQPSRPASVKYFDTIAYGGGAYLGFVEQAAPIPLDASTYTAVVMRSLDGIAWDVIGTVPNMSPAGTVFGEGRWVLVGAKGAISTSADGAIWETQDSKISTTLTSVAYGGGKFVAVGAKGRILSSTSGKKWSKEDSGTSDRLETVIYAAGRFVATGENGTLLVSTDGSHWVKKSRGSTRDLDSITSGNGLLVSVGKGGTVLTSTDGVEFQEQSTGVTNDLHGVSWADGVFVAVGEPETILTSPDAIHWTVRRDSGSSSLKSVYKAHGLWVAVGTGGTILTSKDSATWTEVFSPTLNDLNDIAYGAGQFVVVGDNLPPDGTLITSTDGIHWVRRNQYIGKNLRSVTYENGLFVVTSNDGVLLRSENAIDWETIYIGGYSYQNLRQVRYLEDRWILVGNLGTILTSTNLVRWDIKPQPTTENLHGIEQIGHSIVVIGNRGGIFQSDVLAVIPSLLAELDANGVSLHISANVGTALKIQVSPTLQPGSWTDLAAFTTATPFTTYRDQNGLGFPQRFYRVIVP